MLAFSQNGRKTTKKATAPRRVFHAGRRRARYGSEERRKMGRHRCGQTAEDGWRRPGLARRGGLPRGSRAPSWNGKGEAKGPHWPQWGEAATTPGRSTAKGDWGTGASRHRAIPELEDAATSRMVGGDSTTVTTADGQPGPLRGGLRIGNERAARDTRCEGRDTRAGPDRHNKGAHAPHHSK